jgi:hypothetical protein
MKQKNGFRLLLKIVVWLLLSVVGILAGLQIAPSLLRVSVIASVWGALLLLVHWGVDYIHKAWMKQQVKQGKSMPEETDGLLVEPIQRALGILSMLPIPMFAILLLAMPNQGLWLLPIGIMAAAVSLVLGGLSISKKKPYFGWIGFWLGVVFYLFIVIVVLSSQ